MFISVNQPCLTKVLNEYFCSSDLSKFCKCALL